MAGTQGIGTFGINSKFASGSLVFYEKTVGRTATGDVLTIGTGAVKVGGTSQDVDFQFYGTGSISAIIDTGDSSFTLVGINMATNAPVAINDATASTSTATGALVVTGGIGTGADIYVGDDVFLTSAAKLDWNAGDVTITHAANALALAGGVLNLHTSGSPYVFTEGTPAFTQYTSNASTSGSTSAESFLVSNTQTGVGGVGGRARFYMTTNVALAGWSNALKAEVSYGASGRTTGLGSAFVAELALSAGTTSGTYAALEAELTAGSGASAGTATSFLYMNAGTDTDSVINGANGYLFELGAGITDTAGGIFETEAVTSWDATHVLKCRIAGTTYYIPLNTVKNN